MFPIRPVLLYTNSSYGETWDSGCTLDHGWERHGDEVWSEQTHDGLSTYLYFFELNTR